MHSTTSGFLHRLMNRNPPSTTSPSIIPLEEVPQHDDPQGRSSENAEIEQRTLRSVDRGLAAWRLLAVAFIFEALLWGFPLSFGVFQNYYSQLPQFAHNPYIPIVGTVASGICYLGAPLITPFIKRYPCYQRHMIWFGWPLCLGGLAAGSFATTLEGLIMTQGIMYGVGFLILYYPILSFVNEFWVERRGMAYGLLCASSGVSGIVFPFAVEALLNAYGYQTTLRAISIGLAVLTGPLIPFLKGRLPPAENGSPAKSDWSCLKKPLFWVYCASNVIQGLGYFFPSLYLPSYAFSIGLSSAKGALALAILSVSQVLGQFSFGYLSDRRIPLNSLILVSTIMSAVAALALWGFAKSLPVLIMFSLVYGFFGAGYVAMWARMGTAVTKEPAAALSTFSLFCFGKGVGNVFAGPISARLLSPVVAVGTYGAMKYKAVVLFTGTCMLCSVLSSRGRSSSQTVSEDQSSGTGSNQESDTSPNDSGDEDEAENPGEVDVHGGELAVSIVPESRILGLAQIDIQQFPNDDQFFNGMAVQYKRLRGFVRHYFSIWKFHSCSFSMIYKTNPHAIFSGPEALPPKHDRNYFLKRGHDPPLEDDVFNQNFYGCGPACMISCIDVLKVFHECKGRDHCGHFELLRYIPKRKQRWTYDLARETKEAWGLQATFCISLIMAIFYHAIIVAGPALLWELFQKRLPVAWKTVALPLTATGLLLTLFWVPILDSARIKRERILNIKKTI